MNKVFSLATIFAFALIIGATAPVGITYSDGLQLRDNAAAAAGHKEMKDKGEKHMKDKKAHEGQEGENVRQENVRREEGHGHGQRRRN
jgi:hypothetical protein